MVNEILFDFNIEEWLKIIESSGSLDFWNNPEEDIYDLNDGEEI